MSYKAHKYYLSGDRFLSILLPVSLLKERDINMYKNMNLLLFLGYCLNVETVIVLWMICSRTMVLMGAFCLIMMNMMMRKK